MEDVVEDADVCIGECIVGDGRLSPADLVRRAHRNGVWWHVYTAFYSDSMSCVCDVKSLSYFVRLMLELQVHYLQTGNAFEDTVTR